MRRTRKRSSSAIPVARQHNISEETAQAIAVEVRKLIHTAFAEAQRILTVHHDELEAVAQGLLQYESLSGEEIRNLLAGKPPARDTDGEPEAAAPLAVETPEGGSPSELAPRLQA